MRLVNIAAGVFLAGVLVSGCATKRYPIATELSQTQMERMDCEDLALERAQAEETRRQIHETAEVDWRSAAGFLGDFGIGNAMAKNEAETALDARIASIEAAQARKSCNS